MVVSSPTVVVTSPRVAGAVVSWHLLSEHEVMVMTLVETSVSVEVDSLVEAGSSVDGASVVAAGCSEVGFTVEAGSSETGHQVV